MKVGSERVAEGQSVFGEVLQVGHSVSKRGFIGSLVGERQVHMVQPQARHEQREQDQDLHGTWYLRYQSLEHTHFQPVASYKATIA